jgi:hypothetical protein
LFEHYYEQANKSLNYSDQNDHMIHQDLEFFARLDGTSGTRIKGSNQKQGIYREIHDAGRIEEASYRNIPGSAKSEKHGIEIMYMPSLIEVKYFEMGKPLTGISISNNFKVDSKKTTKHG